ncbi:MAG TPA: cell division protein ZapE [Oleiagrimonas sp.]|nr:cell division protein ZapE [Oleiagrimonas sp.]
MSQDIAPPSPVTRYRDGASARRWEDDPAQAPALQAFERLHGELIAATPRGNGWSGKLRLLFGERTDTAPRGIYLWGRVGRGKTFLMDLFVASLPPGTARRRHFHAFMGEVHAALKKHAQRSDPLPDVAADIMGHARVLCLDEFLVDDIGDAMILHGLLRGLVAHDVTLVTTSNTPPSELYRDGLQRARFIPAIKLLEDHCQVVELDSSHDWRLRALEQAAIYQTPPGAEAARVLKRIFDDYAHGKVIDGGNLDINDRPVAVRRRADNIAWFDFDALCDGPRSRADYTVLAKRYAAIIVSEVPTFTPDNHDAAKRFIHLVDALYDQRVKLVLSAATAIIDLYEGERLRAEFSRTESRLIEMQSEDYLALPHITQPAA